MDYSNGSFHAASAVPPVWVVGLHRSGSSVTAGVLHRLGVFMGHPLTGYEDRGTGGFEDQRLMEVCEEIWPFPSETAWFDRPTISMKLGDWLHEHLCQAAHCGAMAGAKFPSLCFAIEVLAGLAPHGRFIHIDRPVDESVRSLIARSSVAVGRFYAPAEQCRLLQMELNRAKRQGLELVRRKGGAVLDVEYSAMLSSPAVQVQRIADFLNLRPTDEQFRRAMELIEPSRKAY